MPSALSLTSKLRAAKNFGHHPALLLPGVFTLPHSCALGTLLTSARPGNSSFAFNWRTFFLTSSRHDCLSLTP